MGNTNMHQARRNKRDEFYTQLSDIENEMQHYRKHFRGKIILMNTDDPKESNFWRYFKSNFDSLGLKKIISTFYDADNPTYKLKYSGVGEPIKTPLVGNGDFRSPEAVELLKEADLVITNPPFSLFREYIAQLIEYDKEFIVMGNLNAVTYREIFPLIKNEKLWLGQNHGSFTFKVPMDFERANTFIKNDQKYAKFGNIIWLTNLDLPKRHEDILLFRTYYGNEDKYPTYDNYNAIEVNRVNNIPIDYDGVMGVPITFLTRYNPEQFEILGSQRWAKDDLLLKAYTGNVAPPENDKKTLINGRETYDRIFIKNRSDV